MPTSYSFTCGPVEARDIDGLTGVVTVVHDVYCEATATDGVSVTVGPWAVRLGRPDPKNFAPLVRTADNAAGAQAQRRGWLDTEKRAEMKAAADAHIEQVRAEQSENRRLVE